MGKPLASKQLAKTLMAWNQARDDYARAYSEREGGIGSRNEALRAEVAYYDASDALHRLLWDGVGIVPTGAAGAVEMGR